MCGGTEVHCREIVIVELEQEGHKTSWRIYHVAYTQ